MNILIIQIYGAGDSVAGIMTRLWAEQSKVQFPAGVRGSSHLPNVQTGSSFLFGGHWGLFPWGKADTSTLPICLHGMDRVNFTFLVNSFDVTFHVCR
jgi:hypothetical protein